MATGVGLAYDYHRHHQRRLVAVPEPSLSLHKLAMEQRNTDHSVAGSVASPGFQAFVSCLEPSSRYHILDLGYPLAANVVQLSSWFPGRVYVADLFRTIEAEQIPVSEDTELWQSAFARVLDFPPGLRFDAIIAWDLFNYLQRASLGALISHLHAFSRSGTVLFAMIATRKTIPARPSPCRIAAQNRISCEAGAAGVTDAPRYSTAALERMMGGFRLQRSFLLSHGVQEYVYRRQ